MAPDLRGAAQGGPPERAPAHPLRVQHLGHAGLRLELAGAVLHVDPPGAVEGPVAVTWTEQERVAGARASTGPLAARAGLLAWLGREGVALESRAAELGGFVLRARAYTPIPYATPPEALRKLASAVRSPGNAARRLAFLATRPPLPPVALTVERAGLRVVLLGQALHRFQSLAAVDALAAWAGPADLVLAGTDYDDEAAAGSLLARFPARVHALADLVGDIRRQLGLPMRPLAAALAVAPPGTRGLEGGGRLDLPARAPGTAIHDS